MLNWLLVSLLVVQLTQVPLVTCEGVHSPMLGSATQVRRDFTVYSHNKKVVCYWGTWANYRPEQGKFTPDNIDPTLCTHLIYSFAGLENHNWTIKSLDPWMDLEDGLKGFRKTTDLKLTHPHLKVTLAIGGWNEGSEKYSKMAADPAARKYFASSALNFIKKHKFDGLDLDWEYPGKRGGSAEDKENFIRLIQDLRKVFKPQGLMLTAAIGAAPDTIDAAYDIERMYKYLDYVHVMCYDYHGKWDKKTGHNSPLMPRPDETGNDLTLNVDYTLQYMIQLGATPEKTVLGVPFYGRAYSLLNPAVNDIGAPAKKDISFKGPYTREDGFLGYNEICLQQKQDVGQTWNVQWDEYYKAPFMFRGDQWLSYDNERSIQSKSEYAYDQGLAGVMVWSIDTDDFLGMCNGPKFPLLRTINHALHMREAGISPRPDTGSGSAVRSSYLHMVTLVSVVTVLYNL